MSFCIKQSVLCFFSRALRKCVSRPGRCGEVIGTPRCGAGGGSRSSNSHGSPHGGVRAHTRTGWARLAATAVKGPTAEEHLVEASGLREIFGAGAITSVRLVGKFRVRQQRVGMASIVGDRKRKERRCGGSENRERLRNAWQSKPRARRWRRAIRRGFTFKSGRPLPLRAKRGVELTPPNQKSGVRKGGLYEGLLATPPR
jgi:hypothetical protein